MNALWENCLLLAARTRMDDLVSGLGNGFREKHARYSTEGVVLVMLGVIALLLLAWLGTHVICRLVRRLRSGRGWLFLRLCQAHGLKWSDCWFLWRLTRFQPLRDPARLFVNPDGWSPAQLDPQLSVDAARLTALRSRLFCDLPERERAKVATSLPPAASPATAAKANPRAGVEKPRTSAAPIIVAPALDMSGWRDSGVVRE